MADHIEELKDEVTLEDLSDFGKQVVKDATEDLNTSAKAAGCAMDMAVVCAVAVAIMRASKNISYGYGKMRNPSAIGLGILGVYVGCKVADYFKFRERIPKLIKELGGD